MKASYSFVWDKKKYFLTWIIFFIIANWSFLLRPYIFGKMLNVLQLWWDNMFRDFVILLAIYSIMPLVFWVFHWAWRLLERISSFNIVKNFKWYIFWVVSGLPFKWHTDNHSWDTVSRITKASKALSEISDNNFMYIETIVNFIWSLIWIILISKYLWIWLLLSTWFILWIILLFDKRLIVQYDEINNRDNNIAALMQDYLSNIRTVITLHLEEFAKNELVRKIGWTYAINKKNFIFNEFKWFSVSMAVNVMIFVVILIYSYYTFNTTWKILVGNLVMLFQYLDKFSWTFFNFARQYENIVRMDTAYYGIQHILDESRQYSQDKDEKITESWKNINIENLNFKYSEKQKKYTLKDISFNFARWERIAFVWESWWWKSTILSIIKWLYEVPNLNLKVDKRLYTNSHVLSNQTTLIPQDPEIFENTIRYNVTFGMEVPNETINNILRLSKFDIVLEKLPKWLDTNIKEKWVNLSGWEKQRLALARWLFASMNSSIIILDEPTSSVDTLNELEIYDNIFKEFPKKTIISSIHKLHLLQNFDRIYLFEKWEIIEQWTFEELLAKNWKVRKMWDSYLMDNKENSELNVSIS